MKTLKFAHPFKPLFALTALILTLALVIPAHAAPTVRPFAGKTTVQPSEDFAGALEALGIELGIIRPAYERRGYISFRIPGGAIDLGSLNGEILHLGGLSLTDGDGTRVELLNFIIDTTDLVLTGQVTVDGDLVARIPLFNLELTTPPEVKNIKLTIRNVNVTLTAEAADALNAVFAVDAFVPDFSIGEAWVKALFYKDHID